ncbi:MAG: hypothetical protein DHS20C21_12610 [Gemmatimonadota bacterium]|nr:MAG: hypothetical protein DHS20C21_12610 [Gemmatimonadota bacterium]
MTEEDRLRTEIDALPREIEPSRDLWPEIEARISRAEAPPAAAAGHRSWRTEIIAAAAALLVFVAGWGVAKLGSGPDPGPGEAGAGLAVPSEPAPDAADLDADYVAASQQLLRTLEEGDLDPELVAQIRRDIESMDAAVQGFQVALAERPDDPRLERQLTEEVRRRGNVLRRIAGIQIAGLQLGENQ